MANSKKARRPFFVGMGDLEAGHWFFGPFKDDQAALDFAEWAAGRIALGSTFSGPHALLDAQVVEAEHERLVKAWLSYPAAERGPLPTISHEWLLARLEEVDPRA